jgi:hypothetical protein
LLLIVASDPPIALQIGNNYCGEFKSKKNLRGLPLLGKVAATRSIEGWHVGLYGPSLLIDVVPHLLMKVISYGVDGGFNQGDGAADDETAADDVTYSERHGEVDDRETDCFSHDISPSNHLLMVVIMVFRVRLEKLNLLFYTFSKTDR